jgi:hypothetical protein
MVGTFASAASEVAEVKQGGPLVEQWTKALGGAGQSVTGSQYHRSIFGDPRVVPIVEGLRVTPG